MHYYYQRCSIQRGTKCRYNTICICRLRVTQHSKATGPVINSTSYLQNAPSLSLAMVSPSESALRKSGQPLSTLPERQYAWPR